MHGRRTRVLLPPPTSGPGGRCAARTRRSACCGPEHPSPSWHCPGLSLWTVTAPRGPVTGSQKSLLLWTCWGAAASALTAALSPVSWGGVAYHRVFSQILLFPTPIGDLVSKHLEPTSSESRCSARPFPLLEGELAFSGLRATVTACPPPGGLDTAAGEGAQPASSRGCGEGSGPGRAPGQHCPHLGRNGC